MPGQNNFLPAPGRFGVMPVVHTTGQIGGADYLGGASPLTANATTIFRAGPVTAQSMFSRLAAVVGVTLPVDADGTVLASVYKYSAADNAAVKLSGDINLGTLTLREGGLSGPGSGVTAASLTLNEGDSLEVHVVSNSAAIDTQPAGVVFAIELLVLR